MVSGTVTRPLAQLLAADIVLLASGYRPVLSTGSFLCARFVLSHGERYVMR